MATETTIQTFVHKLEEGGWAKWIRRGVLWAAVIWVVHLWLFKESGFRGLPHEKAIEQAQISRELARGNGFSTKMIRPAALWQFQSNKGAFPLEVTPDAYHAPLHPAINAVVLTAANKLREARDAAGNVIDPWLMTRMDVLYLPDKIIVAVQTFFFLMGVLVSYFTAKRLFDKRLALLGACLLLLCGWLWEFSMSGLPQMLLLFLFSCAAHLLVRAIEARYAGKSTLWWAVGIGAVFGLLALGHGLTIWPFVGAVLFAGFFFLPRGRDAAIMLAVFSLFYAPWLVRNHQVCGNPVGLGWYSGLFQIRGTETQVMRTMALEGPLVGVTPRIFGEKLRAQAMQQMGNFYQHLGAVLVAPLFFVGLLHLFRKPETAMFRWCVLLMWLLAFFGMCIFGIDGPTPYVSATGVQANDMHVLFLPLMTFYGLAFLLVLWSRLEINFRLARIGFLTLIYLISAMPFLSQLLDLLSQPKMRIHWPPYAPLWIAALNEWTTEREIIASDMPWAVAWYADRKSLWVPMTRKDFVTLNDYNQLGGRMVGLFLTPFSGNRAMLHDIAKGEYKEWAPFILRQVNIRELQDFPLRALTALPPDYENVFYADRDRWTARED